MEISGINSEYLQNAASNASAAGVENTLKNFQEILNRKTDEARTESAALEETSQKAASSVKDEELMGACKEFEAYFIEQVFKEMQKSVNLTQSEDPATKQMMEYYQDNLTGEYAKMAADQQENGLAQMLYEQMKRNLSG